MTNAKARSFNRSEGVLGAYFSLPGLVGLWFNRGPLKTLTSAEVVDLQKFRAAENWVQRGLSEITQGL